ncbi:TolR biopolymer transport protein [Candidatus Fokinia solitaria]|uniref:TolR biopolymer transport protein n=1 Tax=Candidatus Fokinia solitaria TaxID=1802984 RepID=A0A2U8BSY3_9RICK|nr:biopolymer transporter ExbD [Candidatus Fokinia solitaria]AWD33452.1 TolR biopolymer transport protein [Candidatus Fokinia solitaria]
MGIAQTSYRKTRGINSDINITPLVDVMLVLLTIFMVTSSMMVGGIDVDLPDANTAAIQQDNLKESIVVSIASNGDIFIDEIKISNDENFPYKLKAIAKKKKNPVIMLKGDVSVTYGALVSVFNLIKDAGFSDVLLVTLPYDKKLQ